MSDRPRADWFGVLLGLGVFVLGIAILVFTFMQASEVFSRPPEDMVKRDNVDVAAIGKNFADVVLQLGVLVVMSIIGSMISSKGVRMYLGSRAGAITEKPAGWGREIPDDQS